MLLLWLVLLKCLGLVKMQNASVGAGCKWLGCDTRISSGEGYMLQVVVAVSVIVCTKLLLKDHEGLNLYLEVFRIARQAHSVMDRLHVEQGLDRERKSSRRVPISRVSVWGL